MEKITECGCCGNIKGNCECDDQYSLSVLDVEDIEEAMKINLLLKI